MNPPKKIFGLLGYPVKHSLSAAMHNAAFKALKIKAEYRLFEIAPDKINDFFIKGAPLKDTDGNLIPKADIFGLNVTMPHKEAVLKYLHWKSPEVKFIAAANVVLFKEGDYREGWNTDGTGFLRHLTLDLKFHLAGAKIVLLGAGGSAKAIAQQLAKNEAGSVVLYDVDQAKALALAERLKRDYPKCDTLVADSLAGARIEHANLLINATPIGMKDSDGSLIEAGRLGPNLFVYDLIYSPAQTQLLTFAKDKGCGYSNGLGMLLYQGALSFKHFTGQPAPVELMRQALEEATKKI
jgi:shikimate dehydrogenase